MKLSYFVFMAHIAIEGLLQQASRLGLKPIAGPLRGSKISRAEVSALSEIDSLAPGTLVIADAAEPTASYRVDIAIRRAHALQLSGLIFPSPIELSVTAQNLAERGGVPILEAHAVTGSDLAVAIDRILSAGSSDVVSRAKFSVEKVQQAARNPAAHAEIGTIEHLLTVTSEALGVEVTLEEDSTVDWVEDSAVFIGDVPKGRLAISTHGQDISGSDHDTISLVLPMVASILSRALLQEVQDRFAPRQTSGELLAQLVVGESSRVEALTNQAYQRGLPLQLSHDVAWLKFSHPRDEDSHPPRSLQSAVELFALELFENREELWHVAFIHHDIFIVSSETPGSGDHQRRLREVSASIADHAQILAGGEWSVTVGLGTPQIGPTGIRQSATEARIAAETAVASGRAGHIVATDVTGLRRVLLDFYASPTSRKLLEDLLLPLDAQGPQKAEISAQTLLAYLSHRNSPARAAKELMLHPNAVSYRIRQIEEALQLDLQDPDIRFALELACRVRLLSSEGI